jgi:hypothetical protein
MESETSPPCASGSGAETAGLVLVTPRVGRLCRRLPQRPRINLLTNNAIQHHEIACATSVAFWRRRR